MPRPRKARSSPQRRPAGADRAAPPQRSNADPFALLGVAASLALMEREEDIARLTASAVTSALAVPLGAMVTRSDDRSLGQAVGQLGSQPLGPALLAEIRSYCAAPGASAGGPVTTSSAEPRLGDTVMPGLAAAGVKRALLVPLRTVERDYGALIAGKRSPDPFDPTQRAALETLAGQSVVAIRHLRADTERARLAERVQILNELMRIAASSHEVVEVFDLIGKQIRKLIHFERMVIRLRPTGADYCEVYAGAGADALAGEQPRMPIADTPWGEAMAAGRPIISNATPDSVYPVMRDLARQSTYRCGLHVPLKSKGGVFGTLDFSAYELDGFRERDAEVAQAIADHLAVIVEHTQLHEEAKETAKLQERTRLAREIHDTLAQSLTSIVIQLESAEDQLGAGRESARSAIQAARHQARESLEEARRSVWDLQPAALEARDLPAALRREAARLEVTGIDVSFEARGAAPGPIDGHCEQALLRIAQEALTNARKHAQASRVSVVLEYRGEDLRLEITDDGVGFDTEAAPGILSAGGGGFGLTSIQERARLAGGHVRVRSTPGLGTEIVAVVPACPPADEPPVLAQTSVTANVAADADGHIRVLIVDDHEVVRHGIRLMLAQSNGIDVVGEAADGEAALREVRCLSPDVMLLDVQMPKLDGVGVLEQLRALDLDTRAILLSVFAKDEQIFAGLRAGARGYLMKDVGRADLTRA